MGRPGTPSYEKKAVEKRLWREAQADRRRETAAILEKYEASKKASVISPTVATVEGRGPECGQVPALPSARCTLCPVAGVYPRSCGSCTEVR